MDILEKKYLGRDTNFLYKVLQFKNNPVDLVGTGGMASQYYPADFDFLTKIPNKINAQTAYKEFKNIFNKIQSRDDLFFIEFKIQKKEKKGQEPQKKKIFKMEDLNQFLFNATWGNDVYLCKIDLLVYLNGGLFKEVSCIYFFASERLDMNTYIKALLDDQKSYYDEGKYYKSLKRLLLAAKYEDPSDKNLMVLISSLFNSYVGKLYELANEVDAAIIYKNKYGSDKRVKLFIKNIGLDSVNPDKLEDLSKDYFNLINREAKRFYETYDLKVGKLPKWNSKRLKGGSFTSFVNNMARGIAAPFEVFGKLF